MGKRIEFKKTIVFSTEDEKNLYESIIDLESFSSKMTPSAFVISIVEDDYLPENPCAKEYCKRIYLMEKSGEKFFDILGDIFVFLANKTFIDSYDEIYDLLRFFWRIVGYGTKVKHSNYEMIELKNLLIRLELIDNSERQMDYSKCQICPDEEQFILRFLIKKFTDNWKEYKKSNKGSECCMVMSYICRMLPDDIGNTMENRSELIGLIRSISKSWELASD